MHLSAAAWAHVPCPPPRRVGPHLFWRSGQAQFCWETITGQKGHSGLPPARKGKHKSDEGPLPALGPAAPNSCLTCRSAACRQTPRSAPAPLLCPSPGGFLASPPGLSPRLPSSRSSNVSRRRPWPGGAERPAHLRAAPRRDPAAPACAPGGPLPSPHDSLPTAGTLCTASVIFVVHNFCAEGDNNKQQQQQPKPKHACAVSQPVAPRTGR